MNFLYSASLLFRSSVNGEFLEDSLWEEIILLIKATTEAEALSKAQEIGVSRQCSYISLDENKIEWKFFKVERVF